MDFELKNWSIGRADNITIGPLSLGFPAGSVTTLMGPSGVGKTTLLLTMLGYEDAGLTVNGKRTQDGKALAPGTVPKRALYIPQHLPFNPNWEVQGFLSRLPWGNPSFLDLIFPVHSDRRRRVREVLHHLGIAHRAHATIAELSGGEAQRAALAQMLLLKPRLMIGDEFVSALDPGISTWLLDQCRQEISDTGGSAILALHDVQAAMHVSDRILLMWPTSISAQPWQLNRGTLAWRSSVLYSLSCLARWAKDVPPTPALKHLALHLKTWISDERELRELMNAYSRDELLTVDDAGNIAPTLNGIEQTIYHNGSLGGVTEMTPVRLSIEGIERVGVAIPREAKGTSLVVLASTRAM